MTQPGSLLLQHRNVVMVDVMLTGRLSDSARTEHELEVMRSAITRELSELTAALGVPVRCEVALESSSAPVTTTPPIDRVETRSGSEALKLWLDGDRCRFPGALPSLLTAARLGEFPDDGSSGVFPRESWPSNEATLEDVADLIAAVCVEAVKIDPSKLLSRETSHMLAVLLGETTPMLPVNVLHPDRLHSTLSAVLSKGIAIPDLATVGSLLLQSGELTLLDAQEFLIAALARDTVDILVAENASEEITNELTDGPTNLVSFVAQQLFEETGIVLPPLRVLASEALPPDTFSIRINDVCSYPAALLKPLQCLVNDVVDRVAPIVREAKGVINPATGLRATITDARYADHLTSLGFATWSRGGYVALYAACSMRRRAAATLHQGRVVALVEALEDTRPALVNAVRDQLSSAELTELMRNLVGGGVPLGHLTVVMERVVDLPTEAMGPERYCLVDDPILPPDDRMRILTAPDRREQFVRTGLRVPIVDKASHGTGVVVAYLLDNRIEEVACSPNRTEDDEDRIIAAIVGELETLPSTALIPVILTEQSSRAPVQDLIGPSLPDVQVYGHADLPPATPVQPVARISLED